jgi:hypothetical protein
LIPKVTQLSLEFWFSPSKLGTEPVPPMMDFVMTMIGDGIGLTAVKLKV